MNAPLAFAILVVFAGIVLGVAYVSTLANQKRRSKMNIVMPVSDSKVKSMLAQTAPGSAAGKKIYRELYLRTAHWRSFRANAWTHHNGRCAVCGEHVKLHACNIHHLRYFDNSGQSVLFREQYSDVEVVHAGRCHVKADRRRHAQTH